MEDEIPVFVITFATQEMLIFRNAKTGEIVIGAENRVEQCHYAAVITRVEEELDNELTGGWKVVEVCVHLIACLDPSTYDPPIADGTEVSPCIPLEIARRRLKVTQCMISLDLSILLSPLNCCQPYIQHLIVVMSLEMHQGATFTGVHNVN